MGKAYTKHQAATKAQKAKRKAPQTYRLDRSATRLAKPLPAYLDVVSFYWRDASIEGSGETKPETIEQEVLIQSTGFVVKETPTHLTIALQWIPFDAVYRQILNVPKDMIVGDPFVWRLSGLPQSKT